MQEAANFLDLFYISTKLKYSCELINRQKLVVTDYKLRLLKEISDHLAENSYTEYPSITIYYQILMTFIDTDTDVHFEELKNYWMSIPENSLHQKREICMLMLKIMRFGK